MFTKVLCNAVDKREVERLSEERESNILGRMPQVWRDRGNNTTNVTRDFNSDPQLG